MFPSPWLVPRMVLVFQLLVACAAFVMLPALISAVKPEAQGIVALLCAAAVLFDLTFTALGVAWWQRRVVNFNARRVLAVLLSGLIIAGFVVPDHRIRVLALTLIDPLLLMLLGGVAWLTLKRLRTVATAGSPVEQLQNDLTALLPRPLARLMAHEVLTWWCLTRSQPVLPAGSVSLTTHCRAGRVAYVWLYVMGEVPLHLALHGGAVLSGRSDTLGLWLLLGADSLFTLYMLALNRSFERFPAYVQGEQFVLQQGLLWSATIPVAQIEAMALRFVPGSRRLTLLVSPNVTLTLREPVTITGPWGIQRKAQQISFYVDDPQLLKKQIDGYDPQAT